MIYHGEAGLCDLLNPDKFCGHQSLHVTFHDVITLLWLILWLCVAFALFLFDDVIRYCSLAMNESLFGRSKSRDTSIARGRGEEYK